LGSKGPGRQQPSKLVAQRRNIQDQALLRNRSVESVSGGVRLFAAAGDRCRIAHGMVKECAVVPIGADAARELFVALIVDDSGRELGRL
jgi:hypothetical protein